MNTNTTPRAKRTVAPSHPLHPYAVERLEAAIRLSLDALQRFISANPEPDAKTLLAITRLLNTYHKLESLLHAGTAPAPSEPVASARDAAPREPGASARDKHMIMHSQPHALCPAPCEPEPPTTNPSHPPDRPPTPRYKLSPLDPRCFLYDDDPYGLRNLPPLPPLPDDMIELLEQQRLAREAAEHYNPTPEPADTNNLPPWPPPPAPSSPPGTTDSASTPT